MAGSMRDIRRRIRGISNTRQITKAMELVASAKLRKAREQMEKSRPYYNTVYENIQGILYHAENIKHPYLETREVENSLYIVITADRGLAGGFNSNIIRRVENQIRDKKDRSHLITVGLKGREYFKRRDYNVVGEFVGMTEEPSYLHGRQIGEIAMEMYKNREIDEVILVFTEFVSTISQDIVELKLLPNDELRQEGPKQGLVVEYEPSPERVLDYLIPKYIESVIYGALIESASSQQGARRTAMESASDNADEMIEELQLSYNRARQAAITAEISEIVTGAEALK